MLYDHKVFFIKPQTILLKTTNNFKEPEFFRADNADYLFIENMLLPENIRYFSGSSFINEDGDIEIFNSYLDEKEGRVVYIQSSDGSNALSLEFTKKYRDLLASFFSEKRIPWKFDFFRDDAWWQSNVRMVELLAILREQPGTLTQEEKEKIFSYLGIQK